MTCRDGRKHAQTGMGTKRNGFLAPAVGAELFIAGFGRKKYVTRFNEQLDAPVLLAHKSQAQKINELIRRLGEDARLKKLI